MAARFEASINFTLLKWGRARIRMPLEVAAQKIGVDRATLSSWESGETRPTFSKLRDVAKAYQKPLSFFYLSDPPEDFIIPPDFRKFSTGSRPEFADLTSSDDSDVMLAVFDALRRRAIMVDIYSESGWALPSFELSVTKTDPSKQVATQLRAFLGVEIDKQYGTSSPYEALLLWRRALEDRGVLVFQCGISVTEMRGLSIHQGAFPLVLITSKDAPNARIFSLLHELTHLALRQGGICTFSEFGTEHHTEAFCDAVAAETLVPTEALQDQVTISRGEPDQAKLARKFGVSEHVIVRRLFAENMLDERTYRDRMKELASRRFTPNEGGGSHYRNRVAQLGRPFIRTVLAAYEAGTLSTRDAALFLGTKLDGFDKLREVLV